MAYQNNIPGANDELSQSQTDIQGNFAAIETLITVDHVDFNVVNSGMHQAIHFVSQAAPPTTLAAVTSIYCAPSIATPGSYSLFYQGQNVPGVGVGPFEFTGGVFGTNNTTNGYAILPSGLVIQWGTLTIASPAAFVAFPFPTAFSKYCFSLTLTSIAAAQPSKTFICQIQDGSLTKFGAIIQAQATNAQPQGGGGLAYFYAVGI
jgi:hypothetical protein